jgi:hypothetical protein
MKELTEAVLFDFLPSAMQVVVPDSKDLQRDLTPAAMKVRTGARAHAHR